MKSYWNIIGVGILCILFAIFLTACGSGGGSDSSGGEDSSDSSIDAQAAPYVGYWTGSATSKSGQATTIQVSIWENGVVDRRTINNSCNGGVSGGSKGEWNINSYSHDESNGSSTMTINFDSSSLATFNVQHQMDCYTMIGDITKQSSSPQALFAEGGIVYIDAFQFSGTSNYCCWTSGEYTWFTSNFSNSDGSDSAPSYANNAPDGNYAIMGSSAYSLMTGTNATPQSGIKVYIAAGTTGTYNVYGGNTIPTSLCSYGTPHYTCDLLDLGYNPQNYGFQYLGGSNTTQEFSGSYLYYIVKTD